MAEPVDAQASVQSAAPPSQASPADAAAREAARRKDALNAIAAAAAAAGGDADGETKGRWAETIQRVSSAIVVLRVALVRAFAGSAGTFQHATGFVVDAERGIILTNRHVGTFVLRGTPPWTLCGVGRWMWGACAASR